jgi:hypothetical protein
MFRRFCLKEAILIALFSFITAHLHAQPQLPEILGTAERGVVILTWYCQYNGIKSIAVQRSADSVHNFTTVGYVKTLDKGIQAFVDGHPLPGNNFYQLYIVFNSDLTWNSNLMRIHIDSADLENDRMILPPNDSLQKYLITSVARPVTSKKTGIVVNIDTATDKADVMVMGKSSKRTTPEQKMADALVKNVTTPKITIEPNHTDLGDNATVTNASTPAAPVKPKPKITFSFMEDPNEVNPYTFIKARYIYTDPLNGHVTMNLPDDVKSHHYSVKFYTKADKMIMEVPRINASKVVIDKRNFQQKGIYKFILRKDATELETGYVTVF